MARIKLGAIVTAISGSLGGQTFQKSRQSLSMRSKPNGCDSSSPAQLRQRAILLQCVKAWNSLSDVQRYAWENYVTLFFVRSSKDQSVSLSGRELFIRWNAILLTVGYSIVLSPSFDEFAVSDFDFNFYADELSFIIVFDSDLIANDRFFSLNLSRENTLGSQNSRSGLKSVEPIDLGSGAFDIRESFYNQFATYPSANSSVKYACKQFNVLAPSINPEKIGRKSILPLSNLLPGSSWINLGKLTPATYIRDLVYLDHGICLMGTSSNGQLYRSIDYGLNWVSLNRPYTQALYWGFCYLGNGRVLCCTGTASHILESLDYGLTWSILFTLAGQSYISAICNLGNGILLAGSNPSAFILRSTNNGVTWTNLGTQYGQTTTLCFAYCGNGIVICGCTGTGKILRSTDYGLTWSDLGSMYSQQNIQTIVYAGNGICLAGTYPDGYILRSTDYGVTWSNLGTQYSQISIMKILNCSNGLLFAGTRASALILRSTDYGLTWSNLGAQFSQEQVFSLAQLPNGTLLAGTYNGGLLLRSTIFPNA